MGVSHTPFTQNGVQAVVHGLDMAKRGGGSRTLGGPPPRAGRDMAPKGAGGRFLWGKLPPPVAVIAVSSLHVVGLVVHVWVHAMGAGDGAGANGLHVHVL